MSEAQQQLNGWHITLHLKLIKLFKSQVLPFHPPHILNTVFQQASPSHLHSPSSICVVIAFAN